MRHHSRRHSRRGILIIPRSPFIPINPNPTPNLNAELQPDPIIKKHEIFWRVSLEAYQNPRARQIGYWLLIYQDIETCIYWLDNQAIIGFRGTTASKDLYDDIAISLGKVFPRSGEAKKLIQKIKRLNPSLKIKLTGHSLGGAVARTTGEAMQLETVTFNSAAPPSFPVTSHALATDYHISFDIISAWQSPNTVRIDKGHQPVIPAIFQRLIPLSWLWNMYAGILPAHSLTNFSNNHPGTRITTCQENKKIQKWFKYIPFPGNIYILLILLGTQGRIHTSLPPLQ